jgi:hypothetical protein
MFPIQNGLKQGDALSPLFLNFALEYTIKKVQENQVIIGGYHCYQFHTKFYPVFFFQV